MKKYGILTLVFALAACGGGGGGDGDVIEFDFDVPSIPMPATVQSWNGASNGGGAATSTDKDTITFAVDDNGQITSVNFDGRAYAQQGGGNTYVNNTGTRTVNLATLGQESGLTYADFGYLQEYKESPYDTDREFEVFTGGRDRYTNPVTSATYTGTAVAYIQAESADGIANQVSKTSDAQLTIDAAGAQTMTMNFNTADNPWHNVTVNKGMVTLSGNDAVVPVEFQVTSDMKGGRPDTGVDFYGLNADEAVYRLSVEYKNTTGREIEFDGAFGGKKQ